MPYLKKIDKKGNSYYYLYHTIRDGKKFKKASKYLGKEKPQAKELKELKERFLEEINEKKENKINAANNRINLISVLQEIQDKKGYLPLKELERLSTEKGIAGTDIFAVATFYSQFRLEKPAKYTIYVCTGTACHVKKSSSLINYMTELLGIKPGETTENGLVRLETVNCIGACAKAPAVMINDKVYGNVNNNKLKELIEKLK